MRRARIDGADGISTRSAQESDGLRAGVPGPMPMLSEDHRLNLSVDWARGKDNDAWYFYVSESF